MAGPVPTYLTTQLAAQTAFNVPFGLLALVNGAITTATAAGEFNTTVDCSLFTAEDVSNLRIYLDSEGYLVEFAKNSSEKSLLIDWGRFLDIPGSMVAVTQGTTPWIVSGTVAATQSGPWTVSLSSGSIEIGTVDQGHAGSEPWLVDVTNTVNVSVTDFPAVQPISGTVTTNAGTGTFLVDGSAHTQPISGSVSVSNFPATQPVSGTVTALQGTSPWIVSGSISTSPNVNIHDSAGNSLSSTGTSLDVNVTDFPATVAVTQSTSPWVVSGTVAATQSGAWTMGRTWSLASGSDSVSAVQSGTWTVQQGTPPWSVSISNFPATVAVTQSTSPWVVSGTITANAGTGNFTVVQPSGANLHVDVDNFPATQPVSGTVTANQGISPWTVAGTVTANAGTGTFLVDGSAHTQPVSGTVAATQSGAWTTGRTWALLNTTDSVNVGNFPATQPVSGTVTVNQGTSPWVVSGTVTANAGTGTFLVDGSAHTQPVSGTVAVTQSTSPWVVSGTVTANAGSGNFTVVQPTGTNLHTVLDSGTLTSITNALPAGTNVIGHVITDSGSTTAVTGNVTVVQPTGTNLHTVVDSGTIAATQSGTWTTGRTWTLSSGTDSISAVQSGTWTVQPGNTPNTAPWLVEQRAPGISTYSASVSGLVAAATPTDIFTIYGSGTKTVKITRIEVSATQNTSAVRDILLIRRSATNTGGTSSSATVVPHDSNNAAGTATVLSYTANPTSLGASVGTIRAVKADISATNLVGPTDLIEWDFGNRPSQAIVLRGTSQGLAMNLNSVTSASNSFNIDIEWTEE